MNKIRPDDATGKGICMKKRLMVLALAGVLAVGLSSCGKKEVSSNHVQSVTSETGVETSISEEETPDLSGEQPEQVELPESEEVQGDVAQNTEDTQTQEPEQEAPQDNSSQEPVQSEPVSYADRQEIYLDGSWQYADHSAIHSGAAVMYKASGNRNGIVVGVNAGHGTSGGSMSIDLTQTSYSTIPSVDMELGNACSDHSDGALNTQAEGLLQGINNYFGK